MDDIYFLDRESDINEYLGKLPHWHQDDKLQFITLHLADSLPASVLNELRDQKDRWLKEHPEPWDDATRREYNVTFLSIFNKYLDKGYGSCILADEKVCKALENVIFRLHKREWNIWAYVIMPNHIHLLLQINGARENQEDEKKRLKKVMSLFKRLSSHEIMRVKFFTPPLWHGEFYDRLIRDERHYYNVVKL